MNAKQMLRKPAFLSQSRGQDIHSQRKNRRRLRAVHPRRSPERTAGCVLLSAILGVHHHTAQHGTVRYTTTQHNTGSRKK